MGNTNTYRDTQAVDLLDALRKQSAEAKNTGTTAVRVLTFTKSPASHVTLETPQPTATAATIGDYKIVDNRSKLVAFFPFDLDVEDAMNSNDCTVSGTEQYTDAEPISLTHKLRKAFLFDGSSYLTVANESNFDFDHTNTFSVSFRFLLGTIASTQGLIVKSNDLTTGLGWKIYYDNSSGFLVFTLADGTTAYSISGTTTILANIWYRVVCIYAGTSNRSGMSIYMNDTLETTGTSSTISSTILNNVNVAIGAESDGGSKVVNNSKVDDVQIWNVVLNTTDINRLDHALQTSKDTPKPAYLGFSDVS